MEQYNTNCSETEMVGVASITCVFNVRTRIYSTGTQLGTRLFAVQFISPVRQPIAASKNDRRKQRETQLMNASHSVDYRAPAD
jgi:hypothetical protein